MAWEWACNRLHCMCFDVLILENGSLKTSLMACQYMDFMAHFTMGTGWHYITMLPADWSIFTSHDPLPSNCHSKKIPSIPPHCCSACNKGLSLCHFQPLENSCHRYVTCTVYMYLVILSSWQNSQLRFVLINRSCLCKLTSSDVLSWF